MKDYVFLILMLVGITTNAQSCPDNNHPHAIDLGLPSETKWSCSNVGATCPKEFGGYYAWGEIEEKEIYNKMSYDQALGPLYSRVMHLDGGRHDVAQVKCGWHWQMPSSDEISELIGNCSSKWATIDGVNGILFTAKNGNSIFLPAGGKKIEFSTNSKGDYGFYWSDTEHDRSTAYYLYFYNENKGIVKGGMHIGHLVRPIARW